MKQKITKNKSYFDVKVYSNIPAVLTYRILAEDAQEAADLIKNKSPNSVQYKLAGRKDTSLKVYDAGSSIIRFVLNIIKR